MVYNCLSGKWTVCNIQSLWHFTSFIIDRQQLYAIIMIFSHNHCNREFLKLYDDFGINDEIDAAVIYT